MMKQSTKRKITGAVTAACLMLVLGGCRKKQEPGGSQTTGCDVFADCGTAETAGSASFKEKYESLNGQENSSGKEYRTVSLAASAAFTQTDGETVVSMIENKETFYLYVGDEMCPWCRSVIETAEAAAARHGVAEILYIEIWDEEGNEIFRDRYQLEDGRPVRTGEPGPGYEFLLQSFSGYLSDYTLSTDNGESIETGEKRIYAPNFFYVEEGVLKRFTTGISEKQSDPREELTEEMLEDEREAFEYLFG